MSDRTETAIIECSPCRGTGRILCRKRQVAGRVFTEWHYVPCPACSGRNASGGES